VTKIVPPEVLHLGLFEGECKPGSGIVQITAVLREKYAAIMRPGAMECFKNVKAGLV
jgi:hypothetical protein